MVFRQLSVKSKLLATVLGISISSVLIVAVISFTQSQRSLSDAVLRNQVAQLQSRTELIQRFISSIDDEASTLSQDRGVATASAEFAVAAQQLAGQATDPAWDEAATNFYTELVEGLPQTDRLVTVNADQYVPRDPVARYLQHYYTVTNPDPDRSQLDDPGDDSFYSRVHSRFHPSFRAIAERFGFTDIYLIEPESNRIVYSVNKDVDFGTSLASGPWGRSALADVVKEVERNPVPGSTSFSDHEFYRPTLDEPAAFVAAPVFNQVDQGLLGIIALQLPLAEIDRVMTSDSNWVDAGFGQTGETYLVGADLLMRSQSRTLAEDPERFRAESPLAVTQPETLERIMTQGNTVLLQPVRSAAAQRALSGQTGTAVVTSYHGGITLSSYGPLDLPGGLRWVIIADQSLSESEAPVNDLQRALLIATGLILLILTGIAMLMAARFTRPLLRLIDWTGRVGDGDLSADVPVTGGDEIGQLAESVDLMVDNLRTQSETIDSQRTEMQTLILNLMPPQIADRLAGGDTQVADAYPNVTMVVAQLSGFSRYTRVASPGEGKELLDEVIGSFDEVAADLGMEKIRGSSAGYVAASGLLEPRLDQRQRAMQFAVAIDQKLEVLTKFNKSDLELRIGVASGDVEAGIVGQSQISFEVWGDPVSDASALAEAAPPGSVLVAKDIADALRERFPFEAFDTVNSDGQPIEAWRWTGSDN